jgi:sulfite reductase (NADPH) hemoprotein beta-component
VGHIGVLGVDKDGSEWYQVSIGGAQGNSAALGKIIGPSFSAPQMPEVVQRLLDVYLRERVEGERFVDVAQRLGIAPFKEHVYATPITAGELVGEDHYA